MNLCHLSSKKTRVICCVEGIVLPSSIGIIIAIIRIPIHHVSVIITFLVLLMEDILHQLMQ